MNKKSKILATTLAAAAICTAPFALVGCSAGSAEVSEAMTKAATHYYENHIDYDNFKDTTYTLSGTYKESAKVPFTYFENEEDEEPVTKVRNVYSDGKYKETISIRRNGEDLALYISAKDSYSGVEYEATDGELQKIKYSGTSETIYVMNSYDGGYYITKTVTEKAGDEVFEDSTYYQFESQGAYREVIEGYISRLNKLVLSGSYFSWTESEETFMMAILNYSKEFNTYKVSMQVSAPFIDYEESEYVNAMVYTMGMEDTFNGNRLGSYTVSMKAKGENATYEQKMTLSVNEAAKSKDKFNINLEDSEATMSVIEIGEEYFPTEIEMGF